MKLLHSAPRYTQAEPVTKEVTSEVQLISLVLRSRDRKVKTCLVVIEKLSRSINTGNNLY